MLRILLLIDELPLCGRILEARALADACGAGPHVQLPHAGECPGRGDAFPEADPEGGGAAGAVPRSSMVAGGLPPVPHEQVPERQAEAGAGARELPTRLRLALGLESQRDRERRARARRILRV